MLQSYKQYFKLEYFLSLVAFDFFSKINCKYLSCSRKPESNYLKNNDYKLKFSNCKIEYLLNQIKN